MRFMAIYNELKNVIHATAKLLELFLENQSMDAGHELKNRYMHIDFKSESASTAVSKCKKCTLEELAIIKEITKNPSISVEVISAYRQ